MSTPLVKPSQNQDLRAQKLNTNRYMCQRSQFCNWRDECEKVLSASYNAVTSKNTTLLSRGGVAQWVARLARNVEIVSSSPVVSSSKKLYPYCLVLVGSRNGFECDFTIELK